MLKQRPTSHGQPALQKGLNDWGRNDQQVETVPPPFRPKEEVARAKSQQLDHNFLGEASAPKNTQNFYI